MRKLGLVKSVKVVLFAALVVVMAGGATQAYAEKDFNLSFRINFKDLSPEVHLIEVTCYVSVSLSKKNGADFIGSGGTLIRPTNNAVNKTVNVSFDANRGKDKTRAHFARCSVKFSKDGGSAMSPLDTARGQGDAWRTKKQGSRKTTYLTKTF